MVTHWKILHGEDAELYAEPDERAAVGVGTREGYLSVLVALSGDL